MAYSMMSRRRSCHLIFSLMDGRQSPLASTAAAVASVNSNRLELSTQLADFDFQQLSTVSDTRVEQRVDELHHSTAVGWRRRIRIRPQEQKHREVMTATQSVTHQAWPTRDLEGRLRFVADQRSIVIGRRLYGIRVERLLVIGRQVVCRNLRCVRRLGYCAVVVNIVCSL